MLSLLQREYNIQFEKNNFPSYIKALESLKLKIRVALIRLDTQSRHPFRVYFQAIVILLVFT